MAENLRELNSSSGDSLFVYAPDYINLSTAINLLKSPIIKPAFRLYLLNPDESVNREIPQEDIILSSGNYSENYENGQRRSLNISLNNSSGKYNPSVNDLWITNRFKLEIGISSNTYFENSAGNNEVPRPKTFWFPRGVYVLGDPTADRGSSEKKISLSLLDKFAYLEGPVGTLEATYEIPVNTDIKEAIMGILSLDNGMGQPIDPKPFIYDKSFEGMKMPYTLSKDAGSTIGDMILDIGTILNAEVFYNTMGNLTFAPINDVSNDVDKPILWNYDENEAELFNSAITYDFENTINSVHVVGDNINNAIFYAYAENKNPLSSICIQRIGRRILYINDANIFSNKLAKDRARYELRIRGILGTSCNLNVAFNPLLLVNNLITINDSFFKYNREKFLIQSISYNLGTDSQMTVTCSGLTNFTPDPYGDLEYVPCTSEAQAVALILNWFGGSLPSGQSLTKENEDDGYYYYGLYENGIRINYFTISKENSLITTEN